MWRTTKSTLPHFLSRKPIATDSASGSWRVRRGGALLAILGLPAIDRRQIALIKTALSKHVVNDCELGFASIGEMRLVVCSESSEIKKNSPLRDISALRSALNKII